MFGVPRLRGCGACARRSSRLKAELQTYAPRNVSAHTQLQKRLGAGAGITEEEEKEEE
jgi:hypothetical protein